MPDAEPPPLAEAAAHASDAAGRERLFAELYRELHRVAQRELRRNAAVTLTPTTLLHETYLSMCRRDGAAFPDRARFLAYAARAMRGLIVDYARSRQAQKRGGQFEITSLPNDLPLAFGAGVDVDKLNRALEALQKLDPRLAECVDLKFFCGASLTEIAQAWSVSERTVRREWEKARIVLYELMTEDSSAS